MYTFEINKPSEKPVTSKGNEKPTLKNLPPKKVTPRGKDDGYTFTHGVNTFDDSNTSKEAV